MPGGPMAYVRAQLAQSNQFSSQQLNEVMETYTAVRPDEPLLVQFFNYVDNILHGQLGKSMWYDKPVTDILVDAMPWTIFVSAVALLLMYIIGITLGALMAYKEGGRFDISSSVTSIVVTSIPFYVTGVIMLWILSYQWGIFPTGGRVNPDQTAGLNVKFLGSVLYHGTLPIASLVIAGFGNVALGMRGNSISVLGEDYLRVAKLRGLSERRIGLWYVGRNAILPMYTSMMIAIGSLFGGSVILETIFAYPGVGYYLFQALSARDYPLLMGAFIFITGGVILGVYIADLTYGWIDPRAGSGSDRQSYGKTLTLRNIVARIRRRIKMFTQNHISSSDTDEELYFNGGASRQARVKNLDDSVFSAVSEDSMSRRARAYHVLDGWIIAPFKILWEDMRARIGLLILTLFILMGTVGVQMVRKPLPNTGEPLIPPFTTMKFPLGTDGLGQGIFALIVHATPAMMKMISAGALFATGMAVIWGVLSGYKGGRTDRIMMMIADIILTIPGLPLIIVLAAIIQPEDPFVVGIILTVNAWAGFARSLRSEALASRTSTFIEASRTMGISTPNILLKDMLPDLMPLIMVNFVTAARRVIIASVGLYFLGILPFSTLNWGVIMNLAYKTGGALYNPAAAHWFAVPMITIVILSLGLLLLGQGMDRIFNPRIRARHSNTAGGDEEEAESSQTAGGSVAK
jgi:ABC-type dipeptide/oligopeptide/nickel transport system permease component